MFEKRIHSRCEGAQQVEAAEDDDGQEQSIVVEDGEGCCLIVCNLILLPQDPGRNRKVFVKLYKYL